MKALRLHDIKNSIYPRSFNNRGFNNRGFNNRGFNHKSIKEVITTTQLNTTIHRLLSARHQQSKIAKGEHYAPLWLKTLRADLLQR